MIKEAIDTAMVVRREWDNTPFEHRASIFLRIADLLSTKYRPQVLATTMVGQAKTVLQAEIDATCELIDFYRFAVHYAAELYRVQPDISPPGYGTIAPGMNPLIHSQMISALTPLSCLNKTSFSQTHSGSLCTTLPSSVKLCTLFQ
jgi:delta 1-pyrroline-5-carboxylate dehydrogenase